MSDQAESAKIDFNTRIVLVALSAVFIMAGVAVFLLGRDSALTAAMMTLATLLAGAAGYKVGQTRAGG